MTSSGLSSWIYTSFRRTKRRFQGLQRTARYSFEPLDGAGGVSSAKSALLPDIAAAASSPSPRDSLDVDEDVDGVGISNRCGSGVAGGGADGSRPNSVVDAEVNPTVHSTVTSGIVYDAMMESEPSSPTTSMVAANSALSPPSSPPKSPFRKRSSKPFLSLRKKKKSETPPLPEDKKISSSSASEEAKVVGAAAEQPTTPSLVKKDDEVESLRQEVTALKMELKKSEENYKRLSQREKILQDRLAAQALHVLEKSGKFDNINSAELRPTQIVTMFQELYSQGRVDAIDALDELEELEDFDDLKTKILYSVIVLAHRSAKRAVDNIKTNVKDALQLPDTSALSGDDVDDHVGLMEGNMLSNSLEINDPRQASSTQHVRWTSLAKSVEDAVADWLRKTVKVFDLTACLEEVEEQLHATLYDFPTLKDCVPLRDFIESAIRVSWCCSVQNPPFVVEYQHTDFKPECHQRFVSANPENEKISSYVWPGLFEDDNGACLVRGVVIT